MLRLRIECKLERIYNGKISEGKVTSRKYIYTASNGNGMLENVEEVYPDKINSSKKELNLTDKDGIYLTSILPIFETTYKYDEEANNNRSIPERLEYVDIYINGNHSEIKKDDELLQQLMNAVGINQ